MTTRAQKLRLGVFMLLAFLILFGSVVTLAGLKLWNPRDRYQVRFKESVSGLEAGSTVKMKGVRVGQVESIRIDPSSVESVHVTLSLVPNTPVKTDTRAVMTAIGITGLKFIELTGGSGGAKRLQPNTDKSVIPSGESTLQSLTGKATDIATKMEVMLNNLLDLTVQQNRNKVRELLTNVNNLVGAWTKIAEGNTPRRVRRILANVEKATSEAAKAAGSFGTLAASSTKRLASMLASAESAAHSLERATRNFRPQGTLNAITSAARAVEKKVADPSINRAIHSLDSAASHISTLSGDMGKLVRRRDRQLGAILTQLDQTVRLLKRFARAVSEQPSLLLRGRTRTERTVP